MRRLGAIGVLLPLVAFGLSNLWLASAWGRAALASRVQQRCGLETCIGGASWSPWRGVTLRRLTIAQPAALRDLVSEPLLSIDSLRIEPVWSRLFKRQLSIRALTVDQPRLVLTVEMMSHLAQQVEAPPAIPLAATAPAAAPAPDATPAQPAPEVSAKPASLPAQAPAGPAAMPAATPEPTHWLRLRGATVKLQSAASGQVLLEMTDLGGDLPLAGKAASSSVTMRSLTIAGAPVLAGLRTKVSWQAPVLGFEPDPPVIRPGGLEVRCAGQLALQAGLPLQLAVELPRQGVALPLPGLDLTAEARGFMLQARFLGRLLAPGTWQGDLVISATGMVVKHPARTFVFDDGSAAAVIRGGTLACIDARLLGEDLSLLGNGTLLADGRLAAVVRVVAPPETAAAAVQRLFPQLTAVPQPAPLSTPQRVALDLSLSGTIDDPQLRIGEAGPVTPLHPPSP